jgi:SAM-dependent methyltransferase
MSERIERWQRYRSNLPVFSRFILSLTIDRLYEIRRDFATRYITGEGYEIGAQKSPLSCRNAKRVIYIDYLSREESSLKYNIPESECVKIDIIADANNLNNIPSNSASFVIANHVLEHSPDPIGTLLGWLRILDIGGILFLTLPNSISNEFDFEKIPAPINHFVTDYEAAKNNEDISTEHILEHIRLIDGVNPANTKLFEQRHKEIVGSNLHTHYHVYNRGNILDILSFAHQQIPMQLKNTLSFTNSFELLFIIEKAAPDFYGLMPVKQDHLFNFIILMKHITIFLFKRIFSKQ